MVDIHEDVDRDELDGIYEAKHRNTFREVLAYLVDRNPMGPRPEPEKQKEAIPNYIRYKHAPAGREINDIIGDVFPAEGGPADTKTLATKIETNILCAINLAISDARHDMSREQRFAGRQRACFKVTSSSVTLVRLSPISSRTI